MSPPDELPPPLSSMWRVFRRAYDAEPRLLFVSFSLAMLAALPDALLALWLGVLADGVLQHRQSLALGAALGLAVSAAATWFLKISSDRLQRRFRDRLAVALEAHVAKLQATVATIAHHERPDYLDRLAMLRNQVFVLDHIYMSLFSTCGWLLRLGVTLALLVSIHPALAALALFALPTVWVSSWRPGIERQAEERASSANRLAHHLFTVATTAAPGKEVRVMRLGDILARRRRETWEGAFEPVARARWGTALWYAAGWSLFGCSYVAAVAFVATRPGATPGQVLLVLAAGARLSAYVAATVGELGFLTGFWLDGSRRMAWLEDYAAALVENADLPAPAKLERGIEVENVSFAYPGTERLALQDVSLSFKPGTVVAIVGENGAGKSTLVKLMTRMYHPTSGRVTIDGQDLARIRAEEWRSKLAGAFQDFCRFELLAASSVGLGDLPRLSDAGAVEAAIGRAGAEDVVARLAQGLQTQLGATWPGGAELSFGQWQKLALARGFMRDHPLLLALDEPTAALDAETEHALFERYAAAARGDGRITVLVSHRFSTVRMADQIVVLDGARVAEVGSHDALMRAGGTYAQLYGIQAAAYSPSSRSPESS